METFASPWLLLVVTLPNESAAARMRTWRALKALGGAPLRDGAYLFPNRSALAKTAGALCVDIRREGGSAWVLAVEGSPSEEAPEFNVLFDRSSEYDSFLSALETAGMSLANAEIGELGRLQRKLRKDYEAIRSIDYFPNEKSAQAEVAWMHFLHRLTVLQEPDEPHPIRADIPLLELADYQSRRWATRRHIGVDRLSSAWLISRFIDRQASFVWLASPEECPPDALGFDFDGATFTHVGERVSFEVLAAGFGLDKDPALRRLGLLVRSLDIGQGYVPEAAGFDALLSGLRQQAANDDALLAQATPLLDALYASFSAT